MKVVVAHGQVDGVVGTMTEPGCHRTGPQSSQLNRQWVTLNGFHGQTLLPAQYPIGKSGDDIGDLSRG
jgi:hypothetical protein